MAEVKNFELKQLDREAMQQLINWAESEGWNPGPHDADVFWQTDPMGYVGYLNEGELIAGGSVVAYGADFGFMGFFIVKPEWRGKGIGEKLWLQRRDLLLSRLEPGAAIGMDGVLAMQPFYAKGGFSMAFRDERYTRLGADFERFPHVEKFEPEDLPQVLNYDRDCFGFARPQFLIPWLQMPGNYSFVFKNNGQLNGFAIMRKAGKGYKIGPLFADNYAVAEALYCSCLQAVPGEEVFLDIPVTNMDAVKLVHAYEASYVFECARMYYGEPPQLPAHKIFGITSFELG